MGSVRNRKINYLRGYIDPDNTTSIPDLDYDITYPYTAYDAVLSTTEESGYTTLTEELQSIYRMLSDKQGILKDGTAGTLMMWRCRRS